MTPPNSNRAVRDLAETKRLAWTEFQRGMTSLTARPFIACIEITRNCNFKCIMCAQSWEPRYKTYDPQLNMSPALFDRVAAEIFPHLEYAHLQGFGETVVAPHWLDILEKCRQFSGALRFGLTTNLSRRHDEMWRTMVSEDFRIIFSCDGATPETFETIRQGSRFSHIIENLATVAEARRRCGRGGLDFHVVLQRLNYREMPLFVELAARFGADRLTFASVEENLSPRPRLASGTPTRPRQPLPRRLRNLAAVALSIAWRRRMLMARHGTFRLSLDALPAEEFSALKDEALRRATRLGLPVVFNDDNLERLGRKGRGNAPPPPPPPDDDFKAGIRDSTRVAWRGRCFKPYHSLVVNHRGDVGPCSHLLTDEGWEQMGNLAQSPFEEIWNGPAFRAMREKLVNARPDNPTCRRCFERRLSY